MARVTLTDRAVSAAKAAPGKRLELHDALTPGLTLRVTDKGVKTWALRYRAPDGRSQRHKVGDAGRMSLKAARLEAGRLKDLIDKGGDPLAEKRAAKAAVQAVQVRTYGELQTAYFTACEVGDYKPRKKQKRASTLAYEKRLAERHVTPVLGRRPYKEVRRADVRALLRGMMAQGIGAQTNRVHAIIRQVFNFAIAEELAETNPATGFDSLHDSEARRVIWPDDKLAALWRTCQNPVGLKDAKGSKVYVGRSTAIAIQLCTLLLQRRNEVAGMTVAELNLPARTWEIAPDRMKGGKPHLVPLPPRAVELIEEAMKLAKGSACEQPPVVFPSPKDRSLAIGPGALTTAVDRMRASTGATEATVHDLRRTGSTALTSERIGVSPFIRSKVLGHETDAGGGASVSAVHYDANEYLPEKRRALEAWENLLLGLVGERPCASNVTPIRGARGE